jgi:hypothetical protein
MKQENTVAMILSCLVLFYVLCIQKRELNKILAEANNRNEFITDCRL